ncbi:MAG: prepilin-type N-terminal cleavage/methylation domain-containing protein [Candidatus Omnitrophota bacterium]
MRNRNSNPIAFTFIEVLVVLTVFSIIILAVYGVSRGGIEICRRSQNFDIKERKIILGLERLSEGLRQAAPLDKFGPDLPQEWQFRGEEGEVSFISFGENKAVRLSYIFESEESGFFKLRLIQEDIEEEEARFERDLAGGIKRGAANKFFQYLKYNDVTDAYEWVAQWDGEKGLPKAVKVGISYESEDKEKKIFILQ